MVELGNNYGSVKSPELPTEVGNIELAIHLQKDLLTPSQMSQSDSDFDETGAVPDELNNQGMSVKRSKLRGSSQTKQMPGQRLHDKTYPVELIKRSPIHTKDYSLVVKGKKDIDCVKSSGN